VSTGSWKASLGPTLPQVPRRRDEPPGPRLRIPGREQFEHAVYVDSGERSVITNFPRARRAWVWVRNVPIKLGTPHRKPHFPSAVSSFKEIVSLTPSAGLTQLAWLSSSAWIHWKGCFVEKILTRTSLAMMPLVIPPRCLFLKNWGLRRWRGPLNQFLVISTSRLYFHGQSSMAKGLIGGWT
jgi:hypothetical protein